VTVEVTKLVTTLSEGAKVRQTWDIVVLLSRCERGARVGVKTAEMELTKKEGIE
jgi:hypothetical protein